MFVDPIGGPVCAGRHDPVVRVVQRCIGLVNHAYAMSPSTMHSPAPRTHVGWGVGFCTPMASNPATSNLATVKS